MKKYPAVYIEWEDSVQGSVGWRDFEQAMQWASNGGSTIKMVSFLIKKTKKHAFLASRVNPQEHGNTKFGDVFKVPVGCIIKIKELGITS